MQPNDPIQITPNSQPEQPAAASQPVSSPDPAPAPAPVSAAPPATPIAPIPPPTGEVPKVVIPTTTGSGSNTMPSSNVSSTPTSAAQKPKKSKKKLVIIISILVIILLALGGAYYYFMIYQPKTALLHYIDKISKAKTADFSVTVAQSGQDSSSGSADPASALQDPSSLLKSIDLKISGSYDVKEANNAKATIKVEASSSGSTAVSLSADGVLSDKNAYIKINPSPILDAFGIKIPDTWYKTSTDQSSGSTKCVVSGGDQKTSILNAATLSKVPIKNAKRNGLSTTVDGKSVTYFSGEIDMSKLKSAMDDANSKLPEECKVNISDSFYSDYSVSYDLYSSSNFDRLKLNIKNTKTNKVYTVTADTSNYNKDVKIDVPTDAKDIKEILGDLSGSATPTISAEQQAALDKLNAGRKAQLDGLVTMAKAWKTQTGHYPLPTTEWQTSAPGTTGKGVFATTVIKDSLKDLYNSKTYGYTVAKSAPPTCKLTASDTAAPAIIYYQSADGKSYLIRFCDELGHATDLAG